MKRFDFTIFSAVAGFIIQIILYYVGSKEKEVLNRHFKHRAQKAVSALQATSFPSFLWVCSSSVGRAASFAACAQRGAPGRTVLFHAALPETTCKKRCFSTVLWLAGFQQTFERAVDYIAPRTLSSARQCGFAHPPPLGPSRVPPRAVEQWGWHLPCTCLSPKQEKAVRVYM